MHGYENARWTKDKDYLVDNLTKEGADIMLEVANGDQQKQIAQAQTMISNGSSGVDSSCYQPGRSS